MLGENDTSPEVSENEEFNEINKMSKFYKDLTIANFDTLNVQKGTELYYTCFAFGIQ